MQVLTVAAAFLLTAGLLLGAVRDKIIGEKTLLRYGQREDQGEVLWFLRGTRIGTGEKTWFQKLMGKHFLKGTVALVEDQYWMGNRMEDDLYIDSAGSRVKLYLNVQRDSIYLSVLKGEVMVQNQIYGPDKTSRILIRDQEVILFEDVELVFLRADGERRWEAC